MTCNKKINIGYREVVEMDPYEKYMSLRTYGKNKINIDGTQSEESNVNDELNKYIGNHLHKLEYGIFPFGDNYRGLYNFFNSNEGSKVEKRIEHLGIFMPHDDKNIYGCPCIKTIKLSNRLVIRISPTIWMLRKLERIDLSYNKIKYLPKEIGYLRSLEYLNISNNSLERLPAIIGNLSELKELDVSNNCLSELPATISSLKKLYYLNIEANMFVKLPESILGCTSLNCLEFDNNRIDSIPYDFLFLGDLERYIFHSSNPNEYDKITYPTNPKKLLRLEEMCLRKIITDKMDIPSDMPNFLIRKIRSVKECTYCGGPYFDQSVDIIHSKKFNSGKEYTFTENLCTHHHYDSDTRMNQFIDNKGIKYFTQVIKKPYPRVCEMFSAFSYDKITQNRMIQYRDKKNEKNGCFSNLIHLISNQRRKEKLYTLSYGIDLL